MQRLAVQLAIAVPGTTPDYWLTADDRLIVTTLDVIEQRQRKGGKGKRGRGS